MNNYNLNIDGITVVVFLILFALFTFLGFYGAKWRKGDLNKLDEWGLGGRRLGWLLIWFLLGADLFTAYTFIAVPSAFFATGSLYFFAVPYVAWGFGVAMLTMPKLWAVARNKGYVTAADYVKDRFNSKGLAIAVALTGAVAELPYIALQIIGMQAVIAILFIGLGISSTKLSSDLALLIAFIILAAFTFVSGLRGAALSGVYKDILVWITVLTTIGVVLTHYGNFQGALTIAHQVSPKVNFLDLPPKLFLAYWSLALGSTFALYLYPHAINGSLSAESRERLKIGTALLPLYGIGLALITLFGLLIFLVPNALKVVLTTKNGALTVPSLIAATTPDWFTGLAFTAIFIGGLVPAAIMAIGVANLLTRNVIGEFTKLSPTNEARLAKILSTVFKFIALAFVFIVPATYAIQLQLLGGIIVTQTLPAVFLSLFTDKLEKNSTLAGWASGVISGVGLVVYVNLVLERYGSLKTSLFTTPLGPIYIALIALGINLLVTLVGSLVAYASGWRPYKKISAKDFEVEEVVK
ncbi:sodium:solute symporter family protein [Sulfurisphaera ohwakuensis]|uniref:SSS family solute:Na+ symporter n=1 Tax=Sulfurisphaera ohwakuensis TaxID=69656 RepID=A0A650CEL9_SULOH|nr:sodium:solute symporter [Sulfurisphaera ohwakuensis]MBB5252768.1 SSS family solute:Na+ symporter [Sulfurisphaera ohwakuensis]QGR16291.1 sodium:solute symporter [Sulfurisphaera ohwakuensis]